MKKTIDPYQFVSALLTIQTLKLLASQGLDGDDGWEDVDSPYHKKSLQVANYLAELGGMDYHDELMEMSADISTTDKWDFVTTELISRVEISFYQ